MSLLCPSCEHEVRAGNDSRFFFRAQESVVWNTNEGYGDTNPHLSIYRYNQRKMGRTLGKDSEFGIRIRVDCPNEKCVEHKNDLILAIRFNFIPDENKDVVEIGWFREKPAVTDEDFNEIARKMTPVAK